MAPGQQQQSNGLLKYFLGQAVMPGAKATNSTDQAVNLKGSPGDWSGGAAAVPTDMGTLTARDFQSVNQGPGALSDPAAGTMNAQAPQPDWNAAAPGAGAQAPVGGMSNGLVWGDYQRTLDAVVAQGLLPKTATGQAGSGMSFTAPAAAAPQLGKSKSL